MATTAVSPKRSVSWWKKLAVVAFFGGTGFAMTLAAVFGSGVWYNSQPKLPKPWNTNALVAKEPPLFVAKDERNVSFAYPIENETDADYSIDSLAQIKIMAFNRQGTLTLPLPEDAGTLNLPLFIPAKRKGILQLFLTLSGVPKQNVQENDLEYHERLRAYLNKSIGWTNGFAVFDEAHRYEIDLPRWLSHSETEATSQGASASAGAKKMYLGFTYVFDGKSWQRGSKAQRYNATRDAFEPWSDDQYDPLNLFSKEEKAKRLLTEAQIKSVAEQFGVSYDAALEDAKSQGYQVPAKH